MDSKIKSPTSEGNKDPSSSGSPGVKRSPIRKSVRAEEQAAPSSTDPIEMSFLMLKQSIKGGTKEETEVLHECIARLEVKLETQRKDKEKTDEMIKLLLGDVEAHTKRIRAMEQRTQTEESAELKALREEHSTALEKLGYLTKELHRVRRDAVDEVEEDVGQIKRMEERVGTAEKEVVKMEEQASKDRLMAKEIVSATERLARDLRKRVSELEQDNTRLQTQASERSAMLDQANQHNVTIAKQYAEERDQMTEELSKTRLLASELSAQLAQQQLELRGQAEAHDSKQVEALSKELKELIQVLTKTSGDLQESNKANTALEAAARAMKMKIAELEAAAKVFQVENQVAMDRIAQLEAKGQQQQQQPQPSTLAAPPSATKRPPPSPFTPHVQQGTPQRRQVPASAPVNRSARKSRSRQTSPRRAGSFADNPSPGLARRSVSPGSQGQSTLRLRETNRPSQHEIVAQVKYLVGNLQRRMAENGIPLPLKQLEGCTWMLGTRRVTLNVLGGRLVIRAGGGYTSFLEFLERTRIA